MKLFQCRLVNVWLFWKMGLIFRRENEQYFMQIDTCFGNLQNFWSIQDLFWSIQDLFWSIQDPFWSIHGVKRQEMCAISDFYDFSGASRFHKKHRKNRVPNVHTFECKDNEITKWLQSSIQGHRTYKKTFIDYNVLGPKMS